MGRPLRAADGDYIYHVLNRANGRTTIFRNDDDFAAFERVLMQAVQRTKTRLLAYCVMPNHWHLVVWPRENGELSRFVGWLTLTHTQRWHARRGTSGAGHVYQGRFKSFPIQDDDHFHIVTRYVERNPKRAALVRRAEDWRWSSLHRWRRGLAEDQALLAPWPLPRKPNWLEFVNAAQSAKEVEAIGRSLRRGSPFGDDGWTARTVKKLGLESTVRPQGRPRKSRNGS